MDVEQLVVLNSSPGIQGNENEELVVGPFIIPIHAGTGYKNLDVGPATRSEGKEDEGKAEVNTGPTQIPILIPGAGSSGLEHEPHPIEIIARQQSFKMFSEDWILPPDQKRGGRVRVERPPSSQRKRARVESPPPPPKRTRVGQLHPPSLGGAGSCM